MPLDHKRHQIRQLARYTLPCSGLSPRWRGSSVFCRLRWPCHMQMRLGGASASIPTRRRVANRL